MWKSVSGRLGLECAVRLLADWGILINSLLKHDRNIGWNHGCFTVMNAATPWSWETKQIRRGMNVGFYDCQRWHIWFHYISTNYCVHFSLTKSLIILMPPNKSLLCLQVTGQCAQNEALVKQYLKSSTTTTTRFWRQNFVICSFHLLPMLNKCNFPCK